MSKEVTENVEGIETRERARETSHSRDILLALEDRVVTLEESVRDIKERIDDVDDRLNDGLQSMQEQLKVYVLDNVEKLTGRDDAIEAMMTTLKEEIAELKGELPVYKVALGNRGLAIVTPKPSVDVPKPKELKGIRSARYVDNFLWGSNTFVPKASQMMPLRSIDVRRDETEIRTWESFNVSSKHIFIQSMPRMRLGQGCVDLHNKAL
ncbi:hypothetical protein Goklo_025006 [Gossypium klotzschianum]|uniref:Uncharacterized protein n=1 Tax=Gossypium klotzschianum TaxID=34286 RepID=A0A7J8WCJ1_9ROSI|nr:hypothetical protein [Gossypium klotzschianum]